MVGSRGEVACRRKLSDVGKGGTIQMNRETDDVER